MRLTCPLLKSRCKGLAVNRPQESHWQFCLFWPNGLVICCRSELCAFWKHCSDFKFSNSQIEFSQLKHRRLFTFEKFMLQHWTTSKSLAANSLYDYGACALELPVLVGISLKFHCEIRLKSHCEQFECRLLLASTSRHPGRMPKFPRSFVISSRVRTPARVHIATDGFPSERFKLWKDHNGSKRQICQFLMSIIFIVLRIFCPTHANCCTSSLVVRRCLWSPNIAK